MKMMEFWTCGSILKGPGRYLGGLWYLYRYNTEVSTFLIGLVEDFQIILAEIGRGRLIFAGRARGNQAAVPLWGGSSG